MDNGRERPKSPGRSPPKVVICDKPLLEPSSLVEGRPMPVGVLVSSLHSQQQMSDELLRHPDILQHQRHLLYELLSFNLACFPFSLMIPSSVFPSDRPPREMIRSLNAPPVSKRAGYPCDSSGGSRQLALVDRVPTMLM